MPSTTIDNYPQITSTLDYRNYKVFLWNHIEQGYKDLRETGVNSGHDSTVRYAEEGIKRCQKERMIHQITPIYLYSREYSAPSLTHHFNYEAAKNWRFSRLALATYLPE